MVTESNKDETRINLMFYFNFSSFQLDLPVYLPVDLSSSHPPLPQQSYHFQLKTAVPGLVAISTSSCNYSDSSLICLSLFSHLDLKDQVISYSSSAVYSLAAIILHFVSYHTINYYSQLC